MTIATIEQAFNRLQTRERILIFCASLTLILFIFNVTLLQPLSHQLADERQQQHDMDIQRQQLLTELAALTSRQQREQASAEQRMLSDQLADVERTIARHAEQMVPPGKMVELLKQVLQQHHGIELISLQRAASTSTTATVESASSPTYYQHPMTITLRGNYFDVRNYLRDLEELPWRLQWQSLRYEVERYPLARVSIEVTSLSEHKEWLQ